MWRIEMLIQYWRDFHHSLNGGEDCLVRSVIITTYNWHYVWNMLSHWYDIELMVEKWLAGFSFARLLGHGVDSDQTLSQSQCIRPSSD